MNSIVSVKLKIGVCTSTIFNFTVILTGHSGMLTLDEIDSFSSITLRMVKPASYRII